MWEISCAKGVALIVVVTKVANLIFDYLVINRCWLRLLERPLKGKYLNIR